MLKKLLSWVLTLGLLGVLFVASQSLALAQDPDGSESKGEVLPDQPLPPNEPPVSDSAPGASKIPAGELPQLPLPTAPDGTPLYPAPNSLEKRIAMFASLTDEQRAQIKAVFNANQPAFANNYVPAIAGKAALSKEQLQAMNQAGFQWVDSINASLKQILTPEQYATYESTELPRPTVELPPPLLYSEGDISAQTQNDCATAYNLLLASYNSYAYWAHQNALSAYFNNEDPYSFSVSVMLYSNYAFSYYGGQNAYYAYWGYYNASNSYAAYYYGRHAEGFVLRGYQLAEAMYSWTGTSYSYYAAVYGKAAFDNYNSIGDDYALACYAN